MTKCPYSVAYRNECARFSNWLDAIAFARAHSGEIHAREKGTGVIVGQFRNGVATPEFAHLDK